MIAYKLLYFDIENTLRSDPTYSLRSSAQNLPGWLVEWYKEGQVTKMRFPHMPLWACKNLTTPKELRGYTLSYQGHYEIWEAEVILWKGEPYILDGSTMSVFQHTKEYIPELVKDFAHRSLGFGSHISQNTDTLFCETITPIRRLE